MAGLVIGCPGGRVVGREAGQRQGRVVDVGVGGGKPMRRDSRIRPDQHSHFVTGLGGGGGAHGGGFLTWFLFNLHPLKHRFLSDVGPPQGHRHHWILVTGILCVGRRLATPSSHTPSVSAPPLAGARNHRTVAPAGWHQLHQLVGDGRLVGGWSVVGVGHRMAGQRACGHAGARHGQPA